MSTLTEIERAADCLPPEEQQALLLFLAARLRGRRPELPEPREFSAEQIRAWIEQDERELREFDAGR